VRERARERVRSYCGDASPAAAVLSDPRLPAACVDATGWARLGRYVLDARELGFCDLELGAQGDSCVEGARRDFLIEELRRDCQGGRALPALEKEKRACARGDDGRRLASFRPVLYAYPVWAQTHPWRQELLGPNHPPDKFGCTACHEGQGAQTKGVGNKPFAHGYDDPYWERPLLDLVSHEKHRPETWGPPPPTGVPGEIATHERGFVQSSCAKCHSEEVSLRFGDTYARGRQLAAETGCQGCHPIEALKDSPKIGPALARLREKTTSAFLLTWISYPKAFRPRTRMPDFWPEALDATLHVRKGTPEEKLRQDEVRKIAAYLWKSSLPEQLAAPPVRGDARRGKVLAQSLGCRACHTFTPPETFCTADQVAQGRSHGTPDQPGACEVARSFAPNLSNEGLKTNERWLFAWLKDPAALWPQARMPSLRLADQEAADLSAYLMTLKAGAPPEGDGLFADEGSAAFLEAARQGDALVTKYGCAGCHDLPGHEKDAKNGADLNAFGRKSVELMDFGNAIPDPRRRTWYDFTDLKLRAPRAFTYERVETRMPQYDFDDPEVEAMMIFLRSRTGVKVPAAFDAAQVPRLSAMAQGEQVLTWFNCRGCHVIDGRGGDIRDLYLDDDLYKAPPVLQMEGWRTQPGWLFAFLRSPVPQLRPWLTARMPTFALGDARDTALVRSFSASANVTYPYLTVSPKPLEGARAKEAEALFTDLKCLSCHTRGKPPPGTDPQALAPDLELAATRLRPDWVLEWIRVPQQLQEGTRMPQYFGGEDLSAVMYPKYFGGSQAKQIEALRDYVMAMGK